MPMPCPLFDCYTSMHLKPSGAYELGSRTCWTAGSWHRSTKVWIGWLCVPPGPFFCLFSQACPPAHCLVVAGSFGLGVADRLTSLPCTSATFLTLLVNSNGLYLYLQRRRAGLVSPQWSMQAPRKRWPRLANHEVTPTTSPPILSQLLIWSRYFSILSRAFPSRRLEENEIDLRLLDS